MYSERYSLRGRQAHGRRRARRRASAWKALLPLKGIRAGKGVNPSERVKSRVFAPLSRALVGRGGAREVLGWTAVAQCPTLSAKYFSVSLKISICGLTNMAKSTTLPAFRQPVQWWPE